MIIIAFHLQVLFEEILSDVFFLQCADLIYATMILSFISENDPR